MRRIFRILALASVYVSYAGIVDRPVVYKPGPGVQINWNHPLTRGLVGFWILNEGGGTVANDLAIYGPGTLTNSPGWSSGAIGTAVTLVRASSQYIQIAHNANVSTNTNSTLSIEVRFRFPAAGASCPSSDCGLISKTSSNKACPFDSFIIPGTPTSTIHFILGNCSATNDQSIATTLINSSASHVFCGTNGTLTTGNIRIYVDGQIVKDVSGGGASVSEGAGFAIRIGNRNDNLTLFDGVIEYARVWNRELTPNEVRDLYIQPYAILTTLERYRYGERLSKPPPPPPSTTKHKVISQ